MAALLLACVALAMLLCDASPRCAACRLVLLLAFLPLMAWALVQRGREPAAPVDALNAWRAHFERGSLLT